MQQFFDRFIRWLNKNIFKNLKTYDESKIIAKIVELIRSLLNQISCVIMRQKLITFEWSLTHWHKMTMNSLRNKMTMKSLKIKMTMKSNIQLLVSVISFDKTRWRWSLIEICICHLVLQQQRWRWSLIFNCLYLSFRLIESKWRWSRFTRQDDDEV